MVYSYTVPFFPIAYTQIRVSAFPRNTLQKTHGRCQPVLTHHAVDAELVSGELGDHGPLLDVPDADGGQVAALARHEVPPVVREAEARDRLARRVRDVRLPVLPRVVQHHRASAMGSHGLRTRCSGAFYLRFKAYISGGKVFFHCITKSVKSPLT